MAYQHLAYFYDEFNGEANYDALFAYVQKAFAAHGLSKGRVADLACGTGDLTLMLAQAGYELFGVDLSEDMLAVLQDKAEQLQLTQCVFLVHQPLQALDLGGGLDGAVSTFDGLNHLAPAELAAAITRLSAELRPGGVFVFDMNTPYKHETILGNNAVRIEGPDAVCVWQNHYDAAGQRVQLCLHITDEETGEVFDERFYEYTYPEPLVRELLQKNGFVVSDVRDGESFGPLTATSQRMIFTAIREGGEQADG